MRVLFISSGNSINGISPIIYAQGQSLINKGIRVKYYTIRGKGIKGYLSNISRLKEHLKNNNYDIVHAHYSLSAIIATLAMAKPIVVSLMGSDVQAKRWFRVILWFFYAISWDSIIVKSDDMKSTLGLKNTLVIPNGVNLDLFVPLDKKNCQAKLNWDNSIRHILFAANPSRKEKNFQLATQSMELFTNKTILLHTLSQVDNELMPFHFNAADVVILTSLWEGSPNVIKEAMACNCPIVSTDVGDVSWLLGNLPGHFISSFEPEDFSMNINNALDFSDKTSRTSGRLRIVELGLDSQIVASRIIEIYKKEIK